VVVVPCRGTFIKDRCKSPILSTFMEFAYGIFIEVSTQYYDLRTVDLPYLLVDRPVDLSDTILHLIIPPFWLNVNINYIYHCRTVEVSCVNNMFLKDVVVFVLNTSLVVECACCHPSLMVLVSAVTRPSLCSTVNSHLLLSMSFLDTCKLERLI
jgi:hypothetical protein